MISSINVKSVEHQLGIKAKLVATGSYNNEGEAPCFLLNNTLEAEKIYLFKRYDDGVGFKSECVGKIYTKLSTVIANANDDSIHPAELYAYSDTIKISPIGVENLNWDDWYITEYDYVEIYELPIILGGNE